MQWHNLILSEAQPTTLDIYPFFGHRNVKRFNFNFLRTWQPLTRAEPLSGAPIQASVDSYPSQPIEEFDEFPNTSKYRIRQKLMCIAALQSTKACQDL